MATSGKKPYDKIVLVLQGGGALGAYQAGVYQALCEAGFEPDWVVGTSIGAINGAIIAGNPPHIRMEKVRNFWDNISSPDFIPPLLASNPHIRRWYNYCSSMITATCGQRNFFAPKPFFPFSLTGNMDPNISLYSTEPLYQTLQSHIDFAYLSEEDAIRLSVCAVNVTSGKGAVFDSKRTPFAPEHIMASSALPPSFPPISIDGEMFWDGGILSNTPFEVVLEEQLSNNILCFMADLFSPMGEEPTSMSDVLKRSKEISYSSSSDKDIRSFRKMHHLERSIKELHKRLSAEVCKEENVSRIAEAGTEHSMHIVQLIYTPKEYEWDSKDYNFAQMAIAEHWHEGYLDTAWALERSPWLQNANIPECGVIVHKVIREQAVSSIKTNSPSPAFRPFFF